MVREQRAGGRCRKSPSARRNWRATRPGWTRCASTALSNYVSALGEVRGAEGGRHLAFRRDRLGQPGLDYQLYPQSRGQLRGRRRSFCQGAGARRRHAALSDARFRFPGRRARLGGAELYAGLVSHCGKRNSKSIDHLTIHAISTSSCSPICSAATGATWSKGRTGPDRPGFAAAAVQLERRRRFDDRARAGPASASARPRTCGRCSRTGSTSAARPTIRWWPWASTRGSIPSALGCAPCSARTSDTGMCRT